MECSLPAEEGWPPAPGSIVPRGTDNPGRRWLAWDAAVPLTAGEVWPPVPGSVVLCGTDDSGRRWLAWGWGLDAAVSLTAGEVWPSAPGSGVLCGTDDSARRWPVSGRGSDAAVPLTAGEVWPPAPGSMVPWGTDTSERGGSAGCADAMRDGVVGWLVVGCPWPPAPGSIVSWGTDNSGWAGVGDWMPRPLGDSAGDGVSGVEGRLVGVASGAVSGRICVIASFPCRWACFTRAAAVRALSSGTFGGFLVLRSAPVGPGSGALGDGQYSMRVVFSSHASNGVKPSTVDSCVTGTRQLSLGLSNSS